MAPLNPFVDLIHTVQVTTPRVTAKGKVAEISYSMDLTAGKATMTVSLAISGVGAVGAQPEDSLDAPPPPPVPTYTPPIAKSGTTHIGADVSSTFPAPGIDAMPIGYLGNRADTSHPNYDDTKAVIPEFRLQAPAIADELTQPIEDEQAEVIYKVAVPEDTLILTG